ncbi:MAG: protease modulator HflK, partial [Lentisphaerae bacterium]|nr:protease modulator HflK [Lentisphaerota bacterium]
IALVMVGCAVEKAGIVVAALYGPRHSGPPAAVYRSRLAELLVAPEQFVHGVTDVLDYQFGFRVSDTWFFRVLVRAVVPLLALQLGVLGVVSCFVIVNPGEVAIVERWGAPREGDLGPGLHGKLPWPIETVRRLNAARIRDVRIGVPTPDLTGSHAEGRVPGLWRSAGDWAAVFVSASHSAGAPRVGEATGKGRATAPSASLLVADVHVHYRVKSPRAFLYNHAEPQALLEGTVRRCALAYFATHDGAALLQTDRERIASSLAKAIQRRVDSGALPLGVEVLSVAIIRLQPPPAVVDAYQDVVAELQRRTARMSEADAYYHRIVPYAEGIAAERRGEAMAFRSSKVARAEGVGALFKQRLALHSANPRLYRYFSYLDRLERSLGDARKVVVVGGGSEQVISLDLKQEFGPELLDVGLPGATGTGNRE